MYFLSKLCCLCLRKDCNLQNLNLIPINKLLLFIEEITAIPLNVEKFICEKCCNKLDVLYEFRQMCTNNLIKFKGYISQLENQSEIYKPKKRRKKKTSNNAKNTGSQLSAGETVEKRIMESETIEDSLTYPLKTDINDHYTLIKKEENIEGDSLDVSKENEMIFDPEEDLKNVIKQEVCIIPDDESRSETNTTTTYFNQELNTNISRTRTFHKCFDCDKRFTSEEGMKIHFKSTHQRPIIMPYKCSECGQGFETLRTLSTHKAFHGHPDIYKCFNCDTEFNSKKTLKLHKATHKECNRILNKSKKQKKIKFHSPVSETSKLCTCVTCGKHFKNYIDMANHKIVHQLKLKCLCNKLFKSYGKLAVHMRTHEDQRICLICNKEFESNSLLCDHIKNHKKYYPCLICGKNFDSYQKLYYHKDTHFDSPQPCEKCGKVYRSTRNLGLHRARAHV